MTAAQQTRKRQAGATMWSYFRMAKLRTLAQRGATPAQIREAMRGIDQRRAEYVKGTT